MDWLGIMFFWATVCRTPSWKVFTLIRESSLSLVAKSFLISIAIVNAMYCLIVEMFRSCEIWLQFRSQIVPELFLCFETTNIIIDASDWFGKHGSIWNNPSENISGKATVLRCLSTELRFNPRFELLSVRTSGACEYPGQNVTRIWNSVF